MTYASIDLGSDTLKIVVCEYVDNKYNVLASTNTRVVGIKKGVIKDEAMVIKSIDLAVSEIEKQLGFRIDKAIISLPAYDMEVNVYNGECEVSGLVSGSDIATCFKKAIKETPLAIIRWATPVDDRNIDWSIKLAGLFCLEKHIYPQKATGIVANISLPNKHDNKIINIYPYNANISKENKLDKQVIIRTNSIE